MTTAIAVYLYLLAGGLVVLMVRQHLNGTCEMLSIRNMAIAGFIIFQLASGAYALRTGEFGAFFVSDPVRIGLEFAAMASVCLVLAFWAYRRGWIVARLARGIPITWASPGDGGFLWMAFITTVLALILRVVVQVPVLSILTTHVGTGMAAVACGLVGWVWGRRLLNPAFIIYGMLIVIVNFGTVMYGSYGRRGLVAVGACLLWGMYYSYWRHLPTPVLLRRLAIMSIGPILFIALFTSIRGVAREFGRTPDQHLRLIRQQGEVHTALGELQAGQGTGAVSMWILDKYPDEIEYRHLFTIWHFIIYPIPRAVWPDKPTDLGWSLAAIARVPGVDRRPGKGVNYGIGMIGSAAAEGGWYALVIYALLAGLYLRFFDEIVRFNPHSPFIIIAVGSALGEVIGLARGSVSSFAFINVLTVGGTLLYMVIAGKLLERTGGTGGY